MTLLRRQRVAAPRHRGRAAATSPTLAPRGTGEPTLHRPSMTRRPPPSPRDRRTRLPSSTRLRSRPLPWRGLRQHHAQPSHPAPRWFHPNPRVRRWETRDPEAGPPRQASCRRAIGAKGPEPKHGHPWNCILRVMAAWREECPAACLPESMQGAPWIFLARTPRRQEDPSCRRPLRRCVRREPGPQ